MFFLRYLYGALFVFFFVSLLQNSLPFHFFSFKNHTMSSTKPASKKRGQGYSFDEIMHLLEMMENILPIGNDEWDTVRREHLIKFPGQARDINSLRRKYNQLSHKRVPTDDPNCLPEVKRAKRIRIDIRKKANCDTYEDGLSTGDPNCLPEVERAKRILIDIQKKANCDTHEDGLSDEEELSEEFSSPGIDGDVSFAEFMKWTMIQREMDRQEREKERREERQDRKAFYQMMLTMMANRNVESKTVLETNLEGTEN